MTNPRHTSITLGGFVDFSTATASRRIEAVENVIANELGRYEPAHDFYRQFRAAISEGIANGDDQLRVRRAVAECHPRRRDHYQALAAGWETWRRRKNLEIFSLPRQWQLNELEVRLSPQFTWTHRNQKHLVWPYFKDAELSRDAVQAAVRLMELTYEDAYGTPVVLDIRRGTIHRAAARRRRRFDAWLSGEAAAFLSMLDEIRNAA